MASTTTHDLGTPILWQCTCSPHHGWLRVCLVCDNLSWGGRAPSIFTSAIYGVIHHIWGGVCHGLYRRQQPWVAHSSSMQLFATSWVVGLVCDNLSWGVGAPSGALSAMVSTASHGPLEHIPVQTDNPTVSLVYYYCKVYWNMCVLFSLSFTILCLTKI
jgi:hypothetical protein